LISMYKKYPEIIKKNPKFADAANYIIYMIEAQKKQGYTFNKNVNKIYTTMKEIFYDPKRSLSIKQKKMIDDLMKQNMKQQQKKFKYVYKKK